MNIKSRSIQKAFTLIELLIVIAIIGILMVAFLPTLRGGQVAARDAARKANVNNIIIGIEKILNGDVQGVSSTVPVLDAGGCLDFATDVGANIRTALSRAVPSTANNVLLCAGGFFYRSFTGGSPVNFVVVAQVEQTTNGNVSGTAIDLGLTTASALTAVQGAFNTWANTLTRTTGAATNVLYAVSR